MILFAISYLSSTDIVDSIFDKIDEEKSEFIQELKLNEPYDNPLLWKYQLKITKVVNPIWSHIIQNIHSFYSDSNRIFSWLY